MAPLIITSAYYVINRQLKNKKAKLSQRLPCDAPYICVPWKFSTVAEYSHGYFSRNF